MLAIAGGKGGSGKTTTTFGLAQALAERGRSPVVVDADAGMPDLHLVADVPREPGLDAVAAGDQEGAVHWSERDPRVRVVPAGTGTKVATGLQRLQVDGPVLVDCPAGASPAVTDPLRVADETLVVTTPRTASLEDATKSAEMARALSADPLGAVVTRSSRRLSLAGLLGCRCLAAIPPVEAEVLDRTAVRRGYGRVASALEGQKP